MDILLRKLGIEKNKVVTNNFDIICDKYDKKARALGFSGELRFIKEHGKVIVYVALDSKINK
jgi:hypothetical protein